MKLKSVSGIVFYVANIAKTADFYEKLGFTVTEKTTDKLSVRINWFWMDFHAASSEDTSEFKAEANADHKGAGEYLYISVEDVDAAYNEIIELGIATSSEPRDWPWGNREFVVRDPDGYKIVFFAKIKKPTRGVAK